MAAIEGELVEDDSPAKNPEDSGQISCFFLYTNTKNKPIRSLKNRFSERAFLSQVHSLLLSLKQVDVFLHLNSTVFFFY